MEPSAMQVILTSASTVITSAVGWAGQFLHTITKTGNEILLLFVLIPLVGLGIGLVKRLLHV